MLHFSFSLVLGRNQVTSCFTFYLLKLIVKYVMCVCLCVCVCVCDSFLVISNLCDPMDSTRLLCSWDSPGKNTGVGCHSLLQGIFPTQRLNPGLLQCRQSLFCLSHQGSPGEKLSIDWRKKAWILRSADVSSNIFYHLLSLSSSTCY